MSTMNKCGSIMLLWNAQTNEERRRTFVEVNVDIYKICETHRREDGDQVTACKILVALHDCG